MDNFHIDVRADSREAFDLAVRLAFMKAPVSRATHFATHKKYGLILLWAPEPDKDGLEVHPLPYALNDIRACEFAWSWLEEMRGTEGLWEYDSEDPVDSMSGPLEGAAANASAFRIFCEEWGHVGELHCAICAIKPAFAWIGK